MSKHNKYIGDKGEQLAVDHLTANGFVVIARKVYTKSGEIDIIAAKDSITHFVEVKSRTTDELGFPEQAITARKRARMAICAEEYASEHEIEAYQLDAIAIQLNKSTGTELIHFENI